VNRTKQIQEPGAQDTAGAVLLLRLALIPLSAAGRLGSHLGRHIDNDASTVATASRARAVRHARSPALAHGELLGLKRMVRTAVSRVRTRMSHSDYHTGTIANKA
jgi:hypothetical protein